MDVNLISKLVKGQKLIKSEIYNLLYEICDDEHSSCGDNCPVHRINKGPVKPDIINDDGCACFKNGKSMYDFIKEHSRIGVVMRDGSVNFLNPR